MKFEPAQINRMPSPVGGQTKHKSAQVQTGADLRFRFVLHIQKFSGVLIDFPCVQDHVFFCSKHSEPPPVSCCKTFFYRSLMVFAGGGGEGLIHFKSNSQNTHCF